MSPNCKRCGAPTPTYRFEADSTFWGQVNAETKTSVTRHVRILGHYFRRGDIDRGSHRLFTDEDADLCSDCWGLFVHEFLQGRAIPEVKQ